MSFHLPSRKDWAWTFALILAGSLASLALNAVSPRGINLSIATASVQSENQPAQPSEPKP